MAGDIYLNGSKLTGQHAVKLNGTDMSNVYLNGTKLWTKHPHALGTIFTYAWGAGGNIDSLRTSTYSSSAAVTAAFASQPSYSSGSGGADSYLTMTLNAGYYVAQYVQAELGTDSDGVGAGSAGGAYTIYVGGSVSGMSTSISGGFSLGLSGNGDSSFVVKYGG
jgi:hypothetical protein